MLNLCDFPAFLAYKKIMQKMGLERTTHAGNTARKGLPRYTYSCNNQKIIKSISE